MDEAHCTRIVFQQPLRQPISQCRQFRSKSAGHVHRPLLLFVIALNAIVVWESIGKCSATDSIGEPFAASDILFRGHGLIFLQRVLVFDNFFVLLVFRSKLSAFQGINVFHRLILLFIFIIQKSHDIHTLFRYKHRAKIVMRDYALRYCTKSEASLQDSQYQ